jgi:hypothetical protein
MAHYAIGTLVSIRTLARSKYRPEIINNFVDMALEKLQTLN